MLTVWTRRERGPMALGCPTVAIGLALADIVIDIEATTYGITLTPQHIVWGMALQLYNLYVGMHRNSYLGT